MKAFRVLILTLSVVMVTSLEVRGGKLTHKSGIHHVPAVVVQEGLKLKISEIVVQEETP